MKKPKHLDPPAHLSPSPPVPEPEAVDPPPPSPYLPSTSERVAQPVEHLTFNQEVLGSSPSALTNKFNALSDWLLQASRVG